MITLEDYANRMAVIDRHSGELFVQVRLDHCRFLKGNGSACLLLSYYINLLRLKKNNPDDRKLLLKNDFMFQCSGNGIEETFGMTDGRRKTAMNCLEKSGLCTFKRKAGNILWVLVNTDKLAEIEENDAKIQNRRLSKAEKDFQFPRNADSGFRESSKPASANRGIPISKSLSEDSFGDSRPASPERHVEKISPYSALPDIPDKPTGGQKPAFAPSVNRVNGLVKDGRLPDYSENPLPDYCYEFTDRLHKLAEKSQDRVIPLQRKKWAGDFYKIIDKQFSGNFKRIRRNLELLEKHIGEDGWPPSVRHPKNFANLVKWLEEASKREGGEEPPKRRLVEDIRICPKTGRKIICPRWEEV